MRHIGSVRFGCGGQIKARLHDRQFALRAAEEIIGFLGGKALLQRLWIGETDILDRGAGQAAEQEQRFLAGGEHAGKIIERGLRIGATDGFVERGDEVVMPLAILVVHRDATLQKGGQAGGVQRFGKADRKQGLRLVEQEAAVAIRACHQRLARLGL